MPRGLGKPPHERPNWDRLNGGQKRYAYEQYNLARVRRGLSIDHPIPSLDSPEPAPSPALSPDPLPLAERVGYESDSQAVPGNQEQFSQASDLDSVNSMAPASEKRTADAESTSSSATKRTGSILPGSGEKAQVGANAAATNSLVPIPRPIEGLNTSIRVFKKVHRFLTYGISYSTLSKKFSYKVTQGTAQTTHETDNYFMTTPLAMIPWDWDFFYLNPSEYDLLPDGATCISRHIAVRSDNIRIAFPTNASDTELATLNQNKFIRIGKALLQNTPSVNVKFTGFEDKNPMVPTSFDIIKKDDLQKLCTKFYAKNTMQTHLILC
ncbi:hypothetical protein AVEN_205534-1 [Araneus ventricosus]|uniref:Uncharacterized protein n=1 Tax=Araneus ventricosus TaxID=182803 RepID=A0A4Y2G318_ARAVE